MIFPPPLELSLLGLYEPGVPGKERIILRPTESVNLAQFGILVGYKVNPQNITPFNDSFFWFPETVVSTPSWIIVFTGQGKSETVKHPQSGQPVYVFYWGRKKTIFHDSRVSFVVLQMSAVLVGHNPILQLPQKT
jgi:hypothetical protein